MTRDYSSTLVDGARHCLHNGWRFLVSSILGWSETVSLRVGRAICISWIWGSAWTDLGEMLHSTSDVERGHTGIHSSLRGTPSTFSLDELDFPHAFEFRLKNLTSHLRYSSLPSALSFAQDPFRGLWKASVSTSYQGVVTHEMVTSLPDDSLNHLFHKPSS